MRTRLVAAITLAMLVAAPASALAAPVVISKLKWSRRYARAGQNLVATYTASASTTLSFSIHDAAGQPVRDLGDQVPIAAGPHGVDWDGFADSTFAVADGVYALVLTSNDPNGITGKTVAPVTIDTHGPKIHFKSRRLRPRNHVAITVTDPVSGVSIATLLVDGRVVQRSHAASTRFVYVPRGGWNRGRHTVTVLARDRTWNLSEMTRSITVR